MQNMRVNKVSFQKRIYQQRWLLLFVLPGLLTLILFHYMPIFGLQIAFKRYSFKKGIMGSPWVGFENFEQLLRDVTLWPAVRNTVGISLLKLVIGFPMPILFALLLNEVRHSGAKRVIQTISYFPYFISYSVVAIMLSNILAIDGVVNKILTSTNLLSEPFLFLGSEGAFWWIALFTDIWKTLGWNSIIYFAALTAIPLDQYEAAYVDGANRFQQAIHITLPGIKGTIIMLWIMRVGSIVNGANFDLSYLLDNPLNHAASTILPTYVLETGISMGRFSYATALGLIQSTVSLLLVLGANQVSQKLSGEGLF